ncbi:helix-turn-helix domain-containing protein [Pseudoclavibacter sp. 8L]|uniref:helix-turn-helix domain-containing protein n=1 Tax=Pseudoclavibacter sp. 8L TaxID=2653162 RepID=UPI002E29F778|nr:helix-turn-helix transcriptional regulator [Pseudoclavibacter sp. 8L]
MGPMRRALAAFPFFMWTTLDHFCIFGYSTLTMPHVRPSVLHMKNVINLQGHASPASGVIARRSRVAAEVRACMARSDISRSSIEQQLGISQSALSRKLRGLNAFTVDEIFRLADVLGVKASVFFGEEMAA